MINSDETIFLLGAGASVDAKVQASKQMISTIEQLVEGQWSDYKDIYYLIKSSVIYSAGVKGNSINANFNIETLVNTIDELLKSDEHPLYPFVGSWIPKLELLSKHKIDELLNFRKLILDELKNKWIQFETEDANYYSGIVRFRKAYNYPLRIFTLNYDLCIERVCGTDLKIEQGFTEEKEWNWQNFDESNPNNIDVYLYKLHGSINWERKKGFVKRSDIIPDSDKLEIIFATSYKLQYLDPFLFLAYEFRRYTLLDDLKLIIAIGYGFGDEHINGILKQSLDSNSSRRILVIDPGSKESKAQEICEKLKCNTNQIEIISVTAKEFFMEQLSLELLEKYLPDQVNPFS